MFAFPWHHCTLLSCCQQQWRMKLFFYFHGNVGYVNTAEHNIVCILAFLYCTKFEVLKTVTRNIIATYKNLFGTNICVWQFADNFAL